ncbi:hypothetical protein PV729_45550 [Streptomyces europaeiscabiei]|uniref:DUF2087 domain-containing protein n=1 Tax=Streptomyces europaeiscabiei TaxID=146819 RepID=A0ABU4NZD3_9ACTN|nr:hypothetical protein [Streptomyces europaeiscabiei]MDX2763370.1 hypothetical protein [Streptomyces europaeiscabiei]MDX3544369.1 hypothetical protein [Streptomyces europaeiscabiei]MDX3558842.1 hypothetical protein [Streptomyces europaeiscabiei]MDX3707222.1 hypothetical protein [Streptomyces europaeiscabiei]
MADRDRRLSLLAEILRIGGRITTGQAHAFYQATGWGPCRSTARADLKYYVRRGVLAAHGPDNGRLYALAPTRGGAR